MEIANAVIIPKTKNCYVRLKDKLSSLYEVDVQGMSYEGITVSIWYEDIFSLCDLAEQISDWDNVLDFQLTGFNLQRANKFH